MKRLIQLSVIMLLVVALAGIAAAQTPDETLIDDFLNARGLILNDAAKTSVAQVWLQNMATVRPTLEAWVTRATGGGGNTDAE